MCVLLVIISDLELKYYYKRKVEEGKNKMFVINNIRNKLVYCIFVCVKNNKMYERREVV